MTDAELRDAGVAELEKTTDPYPTWVRKGRPTNSHWAKALDFLAQIAATPPPSSALKGMYVSNAAPSWPGANGIQAKTGCNMMICGADDYAALAALRTTGGKAWAKAGYWQDKSGTFSTSDAQAVAMAKNVAANWADVVEGWYLADEPTNNAANRATITKRGALLKSAYPAETEIAYYDAGSVAQWKNVVDAFALDIYPSSHNWDMSLIPKLAAAADQAGLRYYGVIGCDGAPNYPMPTAAQLQTMIDLWKATKQAGWLVYAWDSPGQLKNQAALLDVLKANA